MDPGTQKRVGISPSTTSPDECREATGDGERDKGELSMAMAEPRGVLRQQLDSWREMFASMSLTNWLVLFLSCFLMMTAFPASSILTRLYFVDGGRSKWLVSWLAPAGWPLTAALLLVFCLKKGESPTPLSWTLLFWYALLGVLSAADNLMFAWAYAYLPASTAALLSSTSLTFTAILAFFLVGQTFTFSTVNAVAIMTTAAVILGLDSDSDRPYGTTSREYAVGFVLAIAASALHGLIFALSELLFIRVLGRMSFRVVLESQTAVSVFATLFTGVGLIIAGDFGMITDEAGTFSLGPSAYYQTLVWLAITFQLGILGSVGCLYLASTLLAGVFNAARVPVTAIAAVICFRDPMGGFKILAIVLTVWSFASYLWSSYELRPAKHRAILSRSDSGSGLSEALHGGATYV